jgi:hypothetical protein
MPSSDKLGVFAVLLADTLETYTGLCPRALLASYEPDCQRSSECLCTESIFSKLAWLEGSIPGFREC